MKMRVARFAYLGTEGVSSDGVRWWLTPAAIFCASRLVTLLLANWASMVTSFSVGDVLTQWDGNWYQILADDGYGEFGSGTPPTLAFLPGLPVGVGFLSDITGIDSARIGVAVSFTCGLLCFILLWKLVADVAGDTEIASYSIVLLAFSPSAFVFSMYYTESVALLLVVLAFRFMHGEQWLYCGVAVLACGVVRPSGFVLAVPLLVTAYSAFRAGKQWLRPLAVAALAPLGLVGWIAFVASWTNDTSAYFVVQDLFWDSGVDFGATSFEGLLDLLLVDVEDADHLGHSLALLTLGLGGLVCVRRARLPLSWQWFAAATVALVVVNERQTSSGRFLILAFPLFVGLAQVIPVRWRPTILAVSATAMGGAFMMSSVTLMYTP